MIIIGEKLNTSIKLTKEAAANNDSKFIKDMAKKQVENGADYLDVNCGTFLDDEPNKMEWMVNTVQEAVNVPICIDSPNPKALEAGLKANNGEVPIVNSITAERERWEAILPLIIDYKTKVIALCMDDNGIPEEPEGRLKIALNIANEMARKGQKAEDIFFDPMVQPVSTNTNNALVTLETIRRIKREIPRANTVCGLSNISYGLPARRLVNQTFLVTAVMAGLDAAIVDPLDRKLMSLVYASEALAGVDEYCMGYITRYREGLLEI